MDDFAKALEQHNYEFQKGQVVRGKVLEHDSNGAYVDIGGKSSAFLPIQEAALRTIANLSEVVPLQEERDFLIIREQDADGQVTLSLRQLQIQEAWEQLIELQESGKVLQVRVSGANKGGVTVDVHMEGISGLLHIKQVSQRYIENLSQLFSPGQILKALVIDLDESRGRISLSTRILENYPGEMVEKMADVMDTAEERSERARKNLS